MRDIFSVKELQPKDELPGTIARAFRVNFGFTLKEVAELTGIGESNLSTIENGKVEMGVHRAKLIAAVFGISPSVILFPALAHGTETEKLKRIRENAAKLLEKKTG